MQEGTSSHTLGRPSTAWVTLLPPKMPMCPVLNAAPWACAFCSDLVHILSHKRTEERGLLSLGADDSDTCEKAVPGVARERPSGTGTWPNGALTAPEMRLGAA